MGLPVNIGELINGITVEWERIEFKEGWNPVEVLHTLCAFANDINNWGGGYIVIGIKENNGRALLPPVGLSAEKIDFIQKELLNLCNRLKPHYFPIVEPVLFHKKKILVIWVPGGQNRPYQAPVTLEKKSQYAYYIRRYSATVKAQYEDEKELISLAGTIPFDDRITHTAEIEDIRLPLVKSFLKEVGSDLYKNTAAMSFEQLCRQMAIVDGPAEYLKPRNVGILFFNDLPQKFIPLSQIEVVEFKTTPGDDQLSEKIFQGPIDQQIRDVLTYLKNVFLKEYIRKRPDRAEADRFFNYPYVALEESIANAMYHRSYEIREPVEIRIHPDRIEILSFPGPDRSIKQDDIEKGILVARRYRNRRIGEFFKELKITEGRCTGIPKMLKALQNNGSPPPVFKTDEERTYFITILKIHPKVGIGEPIESEQVSEQESEQESEQVISILEFCKTARKKQEILTFVGLSKYYKNYQKYILPLVQKGFLSMTYPENPKNRNQKYLTTELGIKTLKSFGKNNELHKYSTSTPQESPQVLHK